MNLRRTLLLGGVLLLVIAGAVMVLVKSWGWYQGLVLVPSVKPAIGSTAWAPPPGSVPIGSSEVPLLNSEADSLLQNPQPLSPASVQRGKRSYDAFCAACHGDDGAGDGPVTKRSVFKPPPLGPLLPRRTDSSLYDTIRNGGPIMPPHDYRIPAAERWDLINYLRSLQPNE